MTILGIGYIDFFSSQNLLGLCLLHECKSNWNKIGYKYDFFKISSVGGPKKQKDVALIYKWVKSMFIKVITPIIFFEQKYNYLIDIDKKNPYSHPLALVC